MYPLTRKVNYNDYFEVNYQENIAVLALTLSSTAAKTSSQATTAAAATTTTKGKVASTTKSKISSKLSTISRQTTVTTVTTVMTTSIQKIKTGNQCLLLLTAVDKLKPTGLNLGQVFNLSII